MGLVGQYSNPEVEQSLTSLVEVLARLKASDVPLRRTPRRTHARPGWVAKAVEEVLATADQPMRGKDIRVAVERALGHPVPASSVKDCLARGVSGSIARFERVSYGRYQLRTARDGEASGKL